MASEKENLENLLHLIKEISETPGNEWFKDELVKAYSITTTNTFHLGNISDIKKDTAKIISVLDINPEISIDYRYIEHRLLRVRLELDNLRMENVRYDLKEKDEMKRLYDFCIYAFNQIENLINYFYYEMYPDINDLLYHLEAIPNTKFKRKEEKNIGDITIATKIYSFNVTYYNNQYTGFNIDSLRLIRNEGVHRCTRIMNDETENIRLHKFLKHATYNSIHMLVNNLSLKIKTIILN